MWDVRPERVDRRAGERRLERPTPWTGPERRAAPDRRQDRELTTMLAFPLSEGWLVFKNGDEKRRLAPIPPNWERYASEQLRELWKQADIIVSRLDERSA